MSRQIKNKLKFEKFKNKTGFIIVGISEEQRLRHKTYLNTHHCTVP